MPRGRALRLPSVSDGEVVKKRAQRRNPELKSRMGAAQSSVAEWVGATISAWAAEEYNQELGQELTAGGDKLHADLARDASATELTKWNQSKVVKPLLTGSISKDVVNTRWAHTWKLADGQRVWRLVGWSKATRAPI